MNDNISVISSPLPFSNFQSRKEFPVGSSLLDIVNGTVPERYTGTVGVIVMLGDSVILDSALPFVRPKQGTIVNIKVVPKGGGGKKNPLTAILSIVVAIAAPALGAAFVATAGLTGVAATIGGAIVSGIVSVVGSLVISAIAPPPKPKAVSSDPSESPTLFIEGARNVFSPYATVPVCLGTNRMFPMQCARPFTENFGNKQYVTQMFTYGFADNIVTSDLKIGDTPIGNFRNVEYAAFEDGNLHVGGELWSRSVRQDNYNILITNAGGWVTRSVPPGSDQVVIDTVFPRGLFTLSDDGKRHGRSVTVDINYRKVGETTWLGGGEYRSSAGAVFTVPSIETSFNYNGDNRSQRIDVVSLDFNTGQLFYTTGETDLRGDLLTSAESLNFGYASALMRALAIQNADSTYSTRIPIARIEVQKEYINWSTPIETVDVFDARTGENFGRFIRDSASFVPSKTGTRQVTISSGFFANDQFRTVSSSAEAVLRSYSIRFPDRGDYEVRIRRVDADSTIDRIFDALNLSAVKGIRYERPVNQVGLSGFGCRIQATEQLNGALEQINAVVSNIILDYESDIDDWVLRPSNNPASIYRYILQGSANANPVADSKIDLDALERWHEYCDERGYTCNVVIDYNTSVDDALRLVASAGSASPDIVDGKRTVVVDRAGKDVTQLITPRNSWGYTADIIYPQLPHAFRVTFRNANNGYLSDERIVYRDGYDASNATLYEELQLPHCTNADLAWRHARRFMATAIYRPEIHTFYMDFENLVSLRGDRIKFQNDVPLVGLGSARIKEVVYDSSGNVVALNLDDVIGYPSSGTFFIRIRYSDGTQIYRPIVSQFGFSDEVIFQDPLMPSDAPEIGDLCAVSAGGQELDLIISKIEPANDLTAKITALNYSPEIFDAELGSIPPFQSVITTPIEFVRPMAPILIDIQSDESVMQRNIDGSFTSQIVITLENRNEGDYSVDVRVRGSGDTEFISARTIDRNPEKVVIVGLDDGNRYDIHIRYMYVGGSVYSDPLQINNYLFVGSSTPPDDVTGIRVEVVGQTAIFNWDSNDDIDFSHYELRFSSASTGATWASSQVLESHIYENRITAIAQSGTYLIKAVDLSGNYSENAAVVSTFGIEGVLNAVEILQESPSFDGFKDNTIVIGSNLVLNDVSNDGYYYFERTIDLTDVFTSYISASLVAGADFRNNIFEIDDVFQVQDIFGSGENNVFEMDDIFSVTDVFGIDSEGWEVEIQIRTTDDNPSDSDADWSSWEPLLAGSHSFRGVEFRAHLQSFEMNVTPVVSLLSVSIDMPDRVERGDDLIVPVTGVEINYSPSFKESPAVAITLQDGDAGDELVYDRKDANGFELRVFNRVSMTYVERIFDFISSGYGRVE